MFQAQIVPFNVNKEASFNVLNNTISCVWHLKPPKKLFINNAHHKSNK